ncbi:Glycosidase [Pedobacter steynii]|uniref:Glycosidase n=1 Tax=Pedobacter steynii TaxID=430522 RepID=A0A1H0H9C2_9SPHI|nr:glycoside hydrolase family 13 protein [Pedobacter steynii]NQX42687.1 glycoside hydrolase family 13 protein [Pedobacter steynii]SDO15713.1 Glycosidase [Pedobacter steynii]
MRRFSFLFFLLLSSTVFAQSKLERIEPMNWWVGMHNPKLQLLIHGNQIAGYEVRIDYPGVKLLEVHKVENPNYLFADLEISTTAKAGKMTIGFFLNGKKRFENVYELKERTQNTNRIQAVTNKDLIYLLMPDRFSNGDPKNDIVKGMKETKLNRDSMYYRHGGDLQGLINKLDYLKDLGITAIWMTPEIENDMSLASYHGYAATDHYKIDPRYGSLALYKTLVDKVHEKGMKIVKDIVHNHMGTEHWFFKDMPMKNWVNEWPVFTQTSYRDEPVMDPHASKTDQKKMLDGWFVPTMPDFNQRNPYVQNYITQNHIWWVEYAGIDGLRLDTYPYNDPEYMKDWANKIKAEFPTLSIFGETLVNSAAAQAYFTGGNTVSRGFDTELPGVTDAVMKNAIYEALNGKSGWTDGVFRLYTTIAQDFLYQDADRNVIFLDNHDMSRFYSMVNEDLNKYKSGMALLLTLRGIPQVYYGTEILMKNYSNPDGLVRSDFPGGWVGDKSDKFTAAGRTPQENEAWNYFRTLANYRKNSPALQSGKMMQYVPENGLYTYFRYLPEGGKTVMVIVNGDDQAKNLETARFAERMTGATTAINIITKEQLNTLKTIAVPAKGTLVLELN